MKLNDFTYHLPDELIAQEPLERREQSRLLCVQKNSFELKEKHFYDIVDMLGENDVLVLNKTSVIPARIFGEVDIYPKGIKTIKPIELLLHKQISSHTWECLGYPGKNLKIGRTLRFYDTEKNLILTGHIDAISEMGRYITFDSGGYEFLNILERLGEMPLPPYITQKLEKKERYQTVFHEIPGSAAAPTAGLHFTQEILHALEKKGVAIEKVLLHVGVGTFKPVEVENIQEHHMHSEYIEIDQDTAKRLNHYKKNGKNIIAVGTTSVRTLESFSDENGIIHAGNKETSIFIYPGYEWRFVDSLITNFHLPASTLLMLVSALAGRETILHAYEYAVQQKFRFFSFGDAMWIQK